MTTSNGRVSKIRRRRGACECCRERKLRCNGERPCGNCLKSDVDCLYTQATRRIIVHERSHRVASFQARESDRAGQAISDATRPTRKEDTSCHQRTPGSIDSGIGDCDHVFSSPRQDLSSLAEVQDQSEVCALSMWPARGGVNLSQPPLPGISENVPDAQQIVPMKGMLRDLVERLPIARMPSNSRQLMDQLLQKMELLIAGSAEGVASTQDDTLGVTSHETTLYMKAFVEKSSFTYISPSTLQTLFAHQDTALPTESALIHAVLATGCRSLNNPSRARQIYRVADELTWNVISGVPSITKLQTLVTMILYTMDDTSDHSIFLLVSNANSMIEALCLRRKARFKLLGLDKEMECFVQRLVWILRSIEGILDLRHGRSTRSASGTIDYLPPKISALAGLKHTINHEMSARNSYFTAICELGHICMHVAEVFDRPGRESQSKISDLSASLSEWRTNLGDGLSVDRDLCTWYYEASFSLCYASYIAVEDCEASVSATKNGVSDILGLLNLGRDLLKTRSTTQSGRENSLSINLLVISWYIIIHAINTGLGETTDMALLSIVSAFFARLSLESSVDCGFLEISQLSNMAQSLLIDSLSANASLRSPVSAISTTLWSQSYVKNHVQPPIRPTSGSNPVLDDALSSEAFNSSLLPTSDYAPVDSCPGVFSLPVVPEPWLQGMMGNPPEEDTSLEQSWQEIFPDGGVDDQFGSSWIQYSTSDMSIPS